MAIYTCVRQVSDYLKGKDFIPDTSDYRYDYYTDSVDLQTAITNLPTWGRIWLAPPWS